MRLGVLSLRDNRIMFLPMEVGNLKELHVMDVSGNRSVYHHLCHGSGSKAVVFKVNFVTVLGLTLLGLSPSLS